MEIWQNQDKIQIKLHKNAQRHSPRPLRFYYHLFRPTLLLDNTFKTPIFLDITSFGGKSYSLLFQKQGRILSPQMAPEVPVRE